MLIRLANALQIRGARSALKNPGLGEIGTPSPYCIGIRRFFLVHYAMEDAAKSFAPRLQEPYRHHGSKVMVRAFRAYRAVV